MQPTIVGLVLVPVSLFLWNRPVPLLQVAIFVAILDAAASLIIGGNLGLPAATMPGLMFVGYIVFQYLLGMRYPGEKPITWTVTPLLLLLIYALVGALVIPGIFAGKVMVWPQKVSVFAFSAVPLQADGSARNQCLYLFLNVIIAYLGSLFLSRRSIPYKGIVGAYMASGYFVTLLSFWQLAARLGNLYYPSDFLYSNPGISVLIQSMGALPRINGPFSEPAALAAFLSGTVFCSLWLCVQGHSFMAPRLLFILSIITMFLSTSATGITTVVLGVPLLLLFVTGRGSSEGRQRIWNTLFSFAGACLLLVGPLFLLIPKLSGDFSLVFSATLNKNSSESFASRTMVDLDALQATIDTYGLGVGWGSFRSSSLLPGVLSNGGIVGFFLIFLFLFRLRSLLAAASKSSVNCEEARLAVSCFSASLLGQIAANLLSGPMITSFSFFLQLACLIGATTRIYLDGGITTTHTQIGSR